jgi:hypothetical protein
MDNQHNLNNSEDNQLQRQYQREVWKERIYRFFYNIWPFFINILNFFFYHTFRILRGAFRTVIEQMKNGG